MTYKDPDKQREAINTCLGCNKAIIQTKGKRQRLWCSDACRIATKRRSEPITEQANSEQSNTEQPITNKPDTEKQCLSSIAKAAKTWRPCKYCGKHLDFAILECCSDCALKQPDKVSPAQDGHILASRPALEFTGKLTDFERERYKSASELEPGQYNTVSKPGDSHYGQA